MASLFSVCEAGAQEGAGPTGQSRDSNLDLARSVAVTGREAFNAGDYETALTLFRRAYALFPAPTVVLYEARTLEKMGLLLEAAKAYSRTTQIPVVAGSPAQFAEALAAARQEGRELEASIPSLTLTLEGASSHDPNLEIAINGRAVGAAQIGQAQRLDPGRYRVSGSVSPELADESEVVLKKGQHVTIVLRLGEAWLAPPAPAAGNIAATGTTSAAEHPIPVLAYVAGGVGVAGIGAGLITGLMANSKYDEADQACVNHECLSGTAGPAAVDAFRTLRKVSTVSYGVGAVGLAAGVVLWLTGADSAESDHVGSIEPWGTVDTAGLRGTF